jgi:hypothetical protein
MSRSCSVGQKGTTQEGTTEKGTTQKDTAPEEPQQSLKTG